MSISKLINLDLWKRLTYCSTRANISKVFSQSASTRNVPYVTFT